MVCSMTGSRKYLYRETCIFSPKKGNEKKERERCISDNPIIRHDNLLKSNELQHCKLTNNQQLMLTAGIHQLNTGFAKLIYSDSLGKEMLNIVHCSSLNKRQVLFMFKRRSTTKIKGFILWTVDNKQQLHLKKLPTSFLGHFQKMGQCDFEDLRRTPFLFLYLCHL